MKDLGCADCGQFVLRAWWLEIAPGLSWYLMKRHMEDCKA